MKKLQFEYFLNEKLFKLSEKQLSLPNNAFKSFQIIFIIIQGFYQLRRKSLEINNKALSFALGSLVKVPRPLNKSI